MINDMIIYAFIPNIYYICIIYNTFIFLTFIFYKNPCMMQAWPSSFFLNRPHHDCLKKVFSSWTVICKGMKCLCVWFLVNPEQTHTHPSRHILMLMLTGDVLASASTKRLCLCMYSAQQTLSSLWLEVSIPGDSIAHRQTLLENNTSVLDVSLSQTVLKHISADEVSQAF